MLPDCDSVSLFWVVTSDPLSRCVGGLPLLKEAGPKSLEWGYVAVAGGGGVGVQMLYVKSPRENVLPPRDGFRAKGQISDTATTTGNSGLHGNLLHQ